ncbi:unnamed protein product [Rotaria magnacalcarata]|uniref:EGF-like domain-containing protein n=2 Tax=Rotaria magnacalcarata TaxID=392030 RepID=A0A816YZ40_9BILA|nr:unnamed protein product [Rotaria magnacalcarata]
MRKISFLTLLTGLLMILIFYSIFLRDLTVIIWPMPRDLTCHLHNCHKRGTCLIGKCFCRPGYDGIDCETAWNQSIIDICATSNDDKCFIHPLYGIGEVSVERWKKAVNQEGNFWVIHVQHEDRWNDHLAGFNNYKMLPNDLGSMVELGCGPFTQTLSILRVKGKHVNIRKLTLWDPNAKHYMSQVKHCSYKNGTLVGFDYIPTIIVSLPSEEMHSYINEFDTILMINVLEHVQNAYQILQNIYNSLRPNGILIFGERWWDQLYTSENYKTDTLHPIRIKYYAWKWFTDHFEKLYDARNHNSYLKYGHNGSYFIGRKKNLH